MKRMSSTIEPPSPISPVEMKHLPSVLGRARKESKRLELEGLRTQLNILLRRNRIEDKETEERFKRLGLRVKKLEEEALMEGLHEVGRGGTGKDGSVKID